MDAGLYRAATQGDLKFLAAAVGNHPSDFFCCVTPQKNTALHITARFGHTGFAKEILSICRPLLFHVNAKGETALHIAARAGSFSLVKLLTDSYRQPSPEPPIVNDVEQGLSDPTWRIKNLEGNTALHEAMRGRHQRVAVHMLELDWELAVSVNSGGESPLYLASEYGLLRVVRRILSEAPVFSREGPDGRTPMHAAVFRSRFRTLKLLLAETPNLVKQKDAFGKTALHYAVTYSMKITQLLMEADRSLAYMTDNEGLTPLLTAARSGRRLNVGVILDYCPDCGELRDPSGRNALHMAIENNTTTLRVKRLLRRPELKELINEPDNDGNTPLHLATKYHLYRIVQQLVEFKGVDLSAKNKEGLTALDISELDWELPFQQTYIWTSLWRHGASRGHNQIWERVPRQMRQQLNHPDVDLKSMANTLSVVATLLATVTFAAAFTMPGGYRPEGAAVLAGRAAVKAFVLADAAALCSSTTVAFLMMWALLGDPGFLRMSVKWGLQILWVALLGTVAAFVTGVYAVVAPESRWLGGAVCAMGAFVPFAVVHLFHAASIITPYTMRFYPRNRRNRATALGRDRLDQRVPGRQQN